MNETVKEILGLLDNGRPELQVAAAQILGELRPRDPAVGKSLEQALAKSNVVGRYALEALAKLGGADALRVVVRCLWEHEGLADQASVLLTEKGSSAHAALAEGWDEAPQDRRGRLLAVLGKHLTPAAVTVFVQAVFMPDLGETAAETLAEAADQFDAKLRKQLHGEIAARMQEVALPDAIVARILGLLGHVDQGGSKALLVRHTSEKFPIEVRAAALRALAGARLTAVQVKEYLGLLEDPKLHGLHDAARDLLSALPEWPGATAGALKKLLTSRNPDQKLFALRALRSCATTEVAKIALKYLRHQDPRFRTAAGVALGANKFAIEPLLKLVQSEKDRDQARFQAGILLQLGPLFQPKVVKATAERAVKLMSLGSFNGELLFDVSITIGGAKVAPLLLERAIRLRRMRRYEESLHILARLARTPHLAVEGQYQLALTRLLFDLARPGTENGQPGDPAMGFFAVLVRDGFPLFDRLRRESALPPEALLRVATHFVNSVGADRRFGADLLQHLAARNKGRPGEEARLALRSAGV